MEAWRNGARLDAWSDYFSFEKYLNAASGLGIDFGHYLRPLNKEAPLPWDHISIGVNKKYLWEQNKKARQEIYTPDCRNGDCHGCGVCDFKQLRPLLFAEDCDALAWPASPKSFNRQKSQVYYYHLLFQKIEEARFLGHLEMMKVFHRAARRANIPLQYSQGYHPVPKMSFGQPIALGVESLCEHAVVALNHQVAPLKLKELFNDQLCLGLKILEVNRVDGKKKGLLQERETAYLAAIPFLSSSSLLFFLKRFEQSPAFNVALSRKNKEVTVDLKQIAALKFWNESDDNKIPPWWLREKNKIFLRLLTTKIYVRPLECIAYIFDLSEEETKEVRLLKICGY